MNVGGRKDDDKKSRMDLVPPKALLLLGDVMRHGAEKYGDHNWREGLKGSRNIAAAMRHLCAYNAGENQDPESGLPHLAHVMARCAMLLETEARHDDRWRPKDLRLTNTTREG